MPIKYTREIHNRLLNKHSDEANQQYLNGLWHLEMLRRPDSIFGKIPRDTQYRKYDIGDNLSSRVSVKPITNDGASYVNTAHLMDSSEARRGVPAPNGKTATTENSAFSHINGADANLIIPQDSQNYNISPGNIKAEFETATQRNRRFDKAIKDYHKKYGEDFYEKMPEIAYDSVMNPRSEVLPGKGDNTLNVTRYNDKKYNGSVLGVAQDGGTSLKSIEPRYETQVEQLRQQKSDLLGQPGSPLMGASEGGVTQTGTSLSDSRADNAADPSRVLKPIVPQNGKNSNDLEVRFETTAERNRKYNTREIADELTKWAIKHGGKDAMSTTKVNYDVDADGVSRSIARAKENIENDYIEVSNKTEALRELDDIAKKYGLENPAQERTLEASDIAKQIQDSWRKNQQKPQVATGTEPLSYAEDGTPEFVKRYTKRVDIEGVDNSTLARKNRLKQFMDTLKNSDNSIVRKFYELWHGDRTKTVLTKLTAEEAAYYKSFRGMEDVNIKGDSSITLASKEFRHEDNSGHFTGIKLKPEQDIWIDANPLTKSDIEAMDTVLKNPDRVIKTDDYDNNGHKILIQKNLSNRMRIVAEVANDGGELRVKSYYKINKTPLSGNLADSRITPQSETSVQVRPLDSRLEANSPDSSIIS